MGQLGFFDADRRLAALSEKGDPLEAITALVPWESFRAEIEAVVLTPDEAKKSKAGRKPFDAIMMFRMLVLQSLYNLSDVQIEYQVWDRATFTRFVGLGSEDCTRRHDAVAVPREARAGRADRDAVRSVRPASHREGLYRARRADGGCEHCADAEAAQHARGERSSQARRDARGVAAEAGQEPPER